MLTASLRYVLAMALVCCAGPALAQNPVLKAQADRVALVQQLRPPVVAIFVGQGVGTGVLISEDGYAVTNFHVVAGGVKNAYHPTMTCGLPDGVLYHAVLVGVDKVGDIALIKLLPKEPGQKFPVATVGDSDMVREGDWTIAMGNPQRLATDFMPTVTFGMVSGTHRYQYPAGLIIEYNDCLQIDTSINPGSSGGPLFNMRGELVGINGRGSVVQDKRGVMNSGVGYAISINQVKNFLGHLKAGLDADHASLGALVGTRIEDVGLGKIVVTQILEDSDVFRRGLDQEDEILSFMGRPITTVNQYKNILGTVPRGWRVPLEFRRTLEGKRDLRKEILVRLMGVQRKELPGPMPMGPDGKQVAQDPKPGKDPKQGQDPKLPKYPQLPPYPNIGVPPAPQASGPAAKFYEAKPGFANYYFNRIERDRLLAGFLKHSDFGKLAGNWTIDGDVRVLKVNLPDRFKVQLLEEKEAAGSKSVVKAKIGEVNYDLEPLKTTATDELRTPQLSGGLLSAMYLYQRLLTLGADGFQAECSHGGFEPFYPPPADGKPAKSLADLRVDCEVLNTRHGLFLVKWFFSRTDQKLLGFEVRVQEANEDPCEVYLYDYRPVQGRQLPHGMQIWYQDRRYGNFTISGWNLGAAS
jgi:S1-C subfamily serine protease